MLGNLLGLPGFDYETADECATTALGGARHGRAAVQRAEHAAMRPRGAGAGALERVADVPIYFADALVRRAPSLQRTADARPPLAAAGALWRSSAWRGDRCASRRARTAMLPARDDELPPNACASPPAHPLTATLGAMFGAVTVEKA